MREKNQNVSPFFFSKSKYLVEYIMASKEFFQRVGGRFFCDSSISDASTIPTFKYYKLCIVLGLVKYKSHDMFI